MRQEQRWMAMAAGAVLAVALLSAVSGRAPDAASPSPVVLQAFRAVGEAEYAEEALLLQTGRFDFQGSVDALPEDLGTKLPDLYQAAYSRLRDAYMAEAADMQARLVIQARLPSILSDNPVYNSIDQSSDVIFQNLEQAKGWWGSTGVGLACPKDTKPCINELYSHYVSGDVG